MTGRNVVATATRKLLWNAPSTKKKRKEKSQMTVSDQTSQRGASISVYFINQSAPKNVKPAKSFTQLTNVFFYGRDNFSWFTYR